jgi:bifunctional DNase/RNase
MEIKELTVGDVWVTEGNQDCMVVLDEKGSDRYLPIWLKREQAEIFLEAKESGSGETNDKSIVAERKLNLWRLKNIAIHQSGNVFTATVRIENEERVKDIEKPISKALALACKAKLPILAEEKLFNNIKSILKANGMNWDKS